MNKMRRRNKLEIGLFRVIIIAFYYIPPLGVAGMEHGSLSLARAVCHTIYMHGWGGGERMVPHAGTLGR